jgi:heme oxygenase (biliverdin-IX-beta and delta-forming)
MQLLLALKAQTAASHTELEESLALFARIQSTREYKALLAKFFTLYEPLEEKLARSTDWSAVGWDFDVRRKAEWLRADLGALHVSEKELNTWTRCNQLPETRGLGPVIGCLYVLEGSMLGAQMISRRFRETLGITPANGGRFFEGYGAETGRQWRAFGAWAQTVSDQAGGLEAPAARGAQQTFECFGRWLKF